MTFAELKRETLALGFEKSFLDEDAFVPAVNRSLKNIFNDLGVINTVKLYAEPVVPLTLVDRIRHFGKSTEVFPLKGKAWSFQVFGTGEFTVDDGGLKRRTRFNTRGESFSGFLQFGGSITFSGDYSYTVKGLATFGEVFGEDVSAIPVLAGKRRFDMSRISPDFLSFEELPTDEEGKEIEGSSAWGSTLTLPWEFEGEFTLSYKRRPREVTINTEEDEQIDAPHGSEAYLSLLVASYVWLIDSPERALHYKALYDEGIKKLWGSGRVELESQYAESNGWA